MAICLCTQNPSSQPASQPSSSSTMLIFLSCAFLCTFCNGNAKWYGFLDLCCCCFFCSSASSASVLCYALLLLPYRDKDYCIGFNFWKCFLYLIRTGFIHKNSICTSCTDQIKKEKEKKKACPKLFFFQFKKRKKKSAKNIYNK